jgi:hypothetical protein
MIEPNVHTEKPEPRQEPLPDRSAEYAEQPPSRPVGDDPLRRSPFLATILSFMPGVGQIYVGYYQLGFVHAIVFAGILALLASGDLGPLIPLLSVFLGFFWLYNVVDAGRRATLVNEALAGRGRFELPEDFTAPGLRGTVLGGSILVGVGLLILFRTLFGVSLAWIEDWWPIAIIAFGGYLIFKARLDARPDTALSGDE